MATLVMVISGGGQQLFSKELRYVIDVNGGVFTRFHGKGAPTLREGALGRGIAEHFG